MTKSEKFDEIVKRLEDITDFNIMKEMKTILNKVFGEGNNQIAKPSFFSSERIAYEQGDSISFANIMNSATNDLDTIENHLKSYFPTSLFYQILIKFPQIEISNDSTKHTIKDLYVRIFVRPNGTIVGTLDGIRGKLSIFEARAQYSHSHLPYCNPCNPIFQQFCTGIGPINQVMMLLRKGFSKPNFMMFCLHLKVFVAWESKEGRPHMYMEDINKASMANHYHLHPHQASGVSKVLLKEMAKVSPETILSFMNYNVLPTKIDVTMNEEFEKWASEEIKSWDILSMFSGYGLEKDCLLNTKDTSGRYHPIPRELSLHDRHDSDSVLLQFKGEDIKLQVEIPEIPDTEIIKDEEKVPHQLITKDVGKKLSNILSKAAFNNARIRLGCAGSSNSKITGSDCISV